MAWTVDSFLAAYPAFAEVTGAREDGVVAAKLAEAALVVSSTVWGAKTDLGVGLYTAHLLSLQPLWDGKMATGVRIVGGAFSSPFLSEFKAHAEIVGRANRVVLFEDEL